LSVSSSDGKTFSRWRVIVSPRKRLKNNIGVASFYVNVIVVSQHAAEAMRGDPLGVGARAGVLQLANCLGG
jgi:hypothetical protein